MIEFLKHTVNLAPDDALPIVQIISISASLIHKTD